MGVIEDLLSDDPKARKRGVDDLAKLVDGLPEIPPPAPKPLFERGIVYEQAGAGEEWQTPEAVLRLADCGYTPLPMPPCPAFARMYDHAIFGATRTKNKNGRIVFEITVGRDGGFVAESIVLTPDHALATWTVTSVRLDGDEEQIEGKMPASLCSVYRGDSGRDYAPKFHATALRTVRIELRRMWAPRPRLVITRAGGRWIALRGQLSRPAPRARPDNCAMTGVVTRRR